MKYHIFLGMEISTDEFFAAIANPIRLRCLALVVQAGELCVCELMYALELSQPMVSRHLAQLRKSGLLRDRREGHCPRGSHLAADRADAQRDCGQRGEVPAEGLAGSLMRLRSGASAERRCMNR